VAADATRFRAALARLGRADALLGVADDALNEALATLAGRVDAACPELAGRWPVFLEHLASVCPAEALGFLAEVHVEDLFLAAACVRGDAGAATLLERSVLGQLPAALRHVGVDTGGCAEILQRLRTRFLVEGKLASYQGRGPLTAWVRAAAVREAVNLIREQHARLESPDSGALERAAAGSDPELELLRSRHGATFRDAVRQAILALPTRERTLLRFSYVDGLSIDELGSMYQVHRATAARWVARAKEMVLLDTRRMVMDRLGLDATELDSHMRTLAAQIELSISGLLAADAPVT
jgi:RNA polymerase sigma-70 factor (ECF subfamily)